MSTTTHQRPAAKTRLGYRFEVAGPKHDAALVKLSSVPMDGAIRIALERRPSFLGAMAVEGDRRQVLVALDGQGAVVATGSRSVRARYLNGTAQPVGYLSALRAETSGRGRTLLARGYAFLKQLHGDGRSRLYLTTIAADNTAALRVLTSGRCGLPAYEPAGTYHTLVIPARRRRTDRGPAGLTIRCAQEGDLERIVAFTRQVGATRQFAPRYEVADFFRGDATFRDLDAGDIRLAFRDGRLVGTLASWDQRRFKQTVVHGYQGVLRWSRPGYNAWARLRRLPRLPAPGTPLRHRVLALPLVLGDEPAVMHALLDETLDAHARDARSDAGRRVVLLGMHERDPLWPTVAPYGRRTYDTRLFVVRWDDGRDAYEALDHRPPYLELGCL